MVTCAHLDAKLFAGIQVSRDHARAVKFVTVIDKLSRSWRRKVSGQTRISRAYRPGSKSRFVDVSHVSQR